MSHFFVRPSISYDMCFQMLVGGIIGVATDGVSLAENTVRAILFRDIESTKPSMSCKLEQSLLNGVENIDKKGDLQ